MADAELWRDMARESFAAGEAMEAAGFLRSAASRFYYAAYQAATALLLYRGVTPPQESDREAWSHTDTPVLIMSQLEPLLKNRDVRFRCQSRLRHLYLLRVRADYQAQNSVTAERVAEVRRFAGYILSVMTETLP